jgi:hypothetical protein
LIQECDTLRRPGAVASLHHMTRGSGMHLNTQFRDRTVSIVLAFCALLSFHEAALAQDRGSATARCMKVHGALLMPAQSGGWQSVASEADVPADRLMVALFGAEFRSGNDAIEMRLLADVGQRGPFPVLEAAVRFHAHKTNDLDATLERGVAVFSNKKKAGAAHMRLQVRDEAFEVTLTEPKARLGVEIYGRHVPGPAQVSDPKLDDPVANVVFFALEGEIVIGTRKHATRLQAPPGNALFLWDSVTREPEVRRFDKLPDFAKPMNEKERQQFDAICGFAKTWAAKPGEIAKSLEKAVRSAEAGQRKAAVAALGALDELPQLMQVLSGKDHADARDMAVLVVRHWLGRSPGQSIRLYEHLTKTDGYTPTQAKNLIYLFKGIEDEKLKHPETYDLLIQALNHSKMPVRELARWHLVRLVPDGKSIAYDAAAAEGQRLQAIAQWRRLIPEGQLPPPPKKKTSTP